MNPAERDLASRRRGHRLRIPGLLLGVAAATAYPAAGSGEVLRYRGEYTFGHEVNSFCPAINSQCYWLHADTTAPVRQALRALSTYHASRPYEPVCILIKGEIDRDTPRSGFAAEYDGLMRIDKVYGSCAETSTVTQGDLQHHRWILTAVDGVAVTRDGQQAHAGPSLEMGERMMFSAHDAGQSVRGVATLAGNDIVFAASLTTAAEFPDSVDSPFNASELPGRGWALSRPTPDGLRLERDGRVLEFRLDDWR